MIRGDAFIYLQIPKTGSTAIARTLVPRYAEQWRTQHTIPTTEELKQRPVVACTIRNPYDRMISAWKHTSSSCTLAQFVSRLEHPNPPENALYATFRRPQFEWANHCNRILRFENLEEDWEAFCAVAGLPEIPLKKANVGKRRNRRVAVHEEYNEDLAERVYNLWYEDFMQFGYNEMP